LVIYDPRVPESRIRGDLEESFRDASGVIPEHYKQLIAKNVTVVDNAYAAANKAHAIAVLTEWDEFKTLDMERVFADMHRPAFVFDGRNIMDARRLEEIGFELYSIGRQSHPIG
jgi:UDPglucose 6-dehydrogenase